MRSQPHIHTPMYREGGGNCLQRPLIIHLNLLKREECIFLDSFDGIATIWSIKNYLGRFFTAKRLEPPPKWALDFLEKETALTLRLLGSFELPLSFIEVVYVMICLALKCASVWPWGFLCRATLSNYWMEAPGLRSSRSGRWLQCYIFMCPYLSVCCW